MNSTYIERLNETLEKSLEQSANEITVWQSKLIQAYNLKKNKTTKEIENDIIILEIYILVSYAIISIATFLRADFSSEFASEKRLNLKYLCFAATEFYKAIFIIKKPNTLWDKLEYILSIGNYKNLEKIIVEIKSASNSFKTNYLNSKRRDITIHYDFDLDAVYNHLCEISEEQEAKMTAALLAVLEPLSLVCSSYLQFRYPNTSKSVESSKENIFYNKFRSELYEQLYIVTGLNIQRFAEYLDQNMSTYHLIDKPIVKELLTEECHARLSEFRECLKLGILLHYFYMDLGTAIRGYLRSENYYEQQLNVIRINVIIYEGYKKIFVPYNTDKKSLWAQYIKEPILSSSSSENIIEANSIEDILQEYSTNQNIKNLRHYFSHFKKNNKLNVLDLWSKIGTINPVIELNKALDFLKLLSRIIKLNKYCLDFFAQKEHEREQHKLIAPLEELFTKAMAFSKTPADKERLQKIKLEFKKMILESFDKVVQKGNGHE